jgi:hypothetical protein
MSANHNGVVTIFDINGTISLTGTGMLATDEMAKKTGSVTSSATPVDLTLGGQVIRRSYTNKQRACTLTLVPYDPDTPGALATHKAKVKLPAEGSTVTLADFDSPDYNGTWNFESGSINKNEAQYVSMTLNLSRVGYVSGAPVALVPQA